MPLSSRGRLPAVEGLDRPNTSVRVMFFDLSSTFNAIQPRLLKTKLKNTQGTVLSPFLFTTYTADFQYSRKPCNLQKFSIAIVGCLKRGREAEYRDLVNCFVKWCGENHLQLNVAKTKEMVVDFRRNKPLPSPVSIMVPPYKYLGARTPGHRSRLKKKS
ncbi:uncharacterized protein ACNS7B_019603 isoform 1-T1 [Menidia menidia]